MYYMTATTNAKLSGRQTDLVLVGNIGKCVMYILTSVKACKVLTCDYMYMGGCEGSMGRERELYFPAVTVISCYKGIVCTLQHSMYTERQ